MRFRGDRTAFGAPGIEPRWTHGNKDGVGTAYSQDSKVWYTLFRGTVTEVYYPLIDHPQVRDLQFLVTDGRSFFHEEKRHARSRTERMNDHTLGYRLRTADPEGRYSISKEVIADPHLPCLLQRTRFHRSPSYDGPLRFHLICAPHLDVGGYGNSGYVVELPGRTILAAERGGTWLALGASVPFGPTSVGYVGRSDAWTDLHDDLRLDWEFDRAPDGNISLVGEIPETDAPFTVALAFGRGLTHAVATLLQALGTPYDEKLARFREQWERATHGLRPLGPHASDRGNLYHASYSLLLAHEDKTFPGAFIASLSIPWGYAKGDRDRGGYHLVWTRDLVQIALGLLASGDTETPLRTLLYLAAIQADDGGFAQNSWLSGEPYWTGRQLDEVSFPILLAARLREAKALGEFDPYPMVLAAARYLVENGPATQQERWEEASGYSPSTLAVNITALVLAATFARERRDAATAELLESYADFLEAHIDRWTVTGTGTVVPGHPHHFARILPVSVSDPTPVEELDTAVLHLQNRSPDARADWPARDIVDAGFLELVRYGVRRADDRAVVDSLPVVDGLLKVATPFGPAWRRYNHDGYGQRTDGGAYADWGVGRAWPLLTGERGHYELAAGRDAIPYLHALERFASTTGLLPEQVWDSADLADQHLFLGRPTGSAMPLMWAHAEYLKLLRSIHDGRVFDRFEAVAARYVGGGRGPAREVWTFHRQPAFARAGDGLRVLAAAPFLLHWSRDGWSTAEDLEATMTPLGLAFVDLPPLPAGGQWTFTFHWSAPNRWEGRDFRVVAR